MSQSLVRHFMSESVKTVTPETSIEYAARRMYQRRISCLVVCEQDTPVGIITERDMTRAYAYERNRDSEATVSEIMSSSLETLSVDASCDEALALLKKNGIRRCVLVDDQGNLQGVITQTDLLRAHASDIKLQKQVLEDRVIERTKELETLNHRLERLSSIDPLLQIGNRRAMDAALNDTHQSANTENFYAVALVDVDCFKAYNDHYGHLGGDQALKELAVTIEQSIRGMDSVFRYGGEEFLIIFADGSLEDAAISAERVRSAVEALGRENLGAESKRFTVSVGVSAPADPSEHWKTVLKRADEALYQAKRNGKNRTEVCAPHIPKDAQDESDLMREVG